MSLQVIATTAHKQGTFKCPEKMLARCHRNTVPAQLNRKLPYSFFYKPLQHELADRFVEPDAE